MDFGDFRLLRKGWLKKLLYEQSITRRSTIIIASALVGSRNINADKLWPLDDDRKKVKMVSYKGMMMTESQARRLAKTKHDG